MWNPKPPRQLIWMDTPPWCLHTTRISLLLTGSLGVARSAVVQYYYTFSRKNLGTYDTSLNQKSNKGIGAMRTTAFALQVPTEENQKRNTYSKHAHSSIERSSQTELSRKMSHEGWAGKPLIWAEWGTRHRRQSGRDSATVQPPHYHCCWCLHQPRQRVTTTSLAP
jgi:hypothetical protein